MLRSTFLHLSGIGPLGEAQLWKGGVRSWQELDRSEWLRRLPSPRQSILRHEIGASEDALTQGDAAFFGRRLPASELWRIYPEFRNRCAFLDIETTSLSPYEGIVTVVTVHSEQSTRTFSADEDLEE